LKSRVKAISLTSHAFWSLKLARSTRQSHRHLLALLSSSHSNRTVNANIHS
jgi:hypothetical protein